MSYIPRYDKGDWIADCDVCGRKYKASQLTQRWDGLMCCEEDWEIRQPQDFVRGVADTQIAPWLRPEPSDKFVPVTMIQWFTLVSNSTINLIATVIDGPASRKATVAVNVVLDCLRRFLITGTKEVNGAVVNYTTLG